MAKYQQMLLFDNNIEEINDKKEVKEITDDTLKYVYNYLFDSPSLYICTPKELIQEVQKRFKPKLSVQTIDLYKGLFFMRFKDKEEFINQTVTGWYMPSIPTIWTTSLEKAISHSRRFPENYGYSGMVMVARNVPVENIFFSPNKAHAGLSSYLNEEEYNKFFPHDLIVMLPTTFNIEFSNSFYVKVDK